MPRGPSTPTPVNAQAYAQLARLLALKENDEQALVEALGAAHRALQLEPENAAFKELLRNIQKRNALTDCAASSVIVVGNSRVHLPKGLVGGVSSDTGRIIETSQPSAKDQKVNRERKSALDDGIDFELFPQAKPALRFINSHGKIGAAIAVRYEPSSGQGSFQYWIYDQKDGRRYEPFRINGDEHPPEEPNSRFNRHARFLHGFYTPGVVEPEKGSMEFHCDPGQPVLQITSHKTDQPLMVLHQFDAPEDGFPIILVRNTTSQVFALGRNGDITLKGDLRAGGAVVVDAAVSEPKHAATKAYVDNAMGALRDEIGRLREELIRLRSAQQDDGGKAPGLPQAPDTVE
jgi:hypothetical protein